MDCFTLFGTSFLDTLAKAKAEVDRMQTASHTAPERKMKQKKKQRQTISKKQTKKKDKPASPCKLRVFAKQARQCIQKVRKVHTSDMHAAALQTHILPLRENWEMYDHFYNFLTNIQEAYPDWINERWTARHLDELEAAMQMDLAARV